MCSGRHMSASPSARKMRSTRRYMRRASSKSRLTSSSLRTRNCFSLYISQKVHLLWLHPIVTCTIRLYASEGGRKTRPSYSIMAVFLL